MRQFKFRFWDVENKIVSNDAYLRWGMTFNELLNDFINDGDYIVMQFSGLHDKNGKEIYEGDIIKDMAGRLWVVSYDKDTACFVFEYGKNREDKVPFSYFINIQKPLEAIGNVYENPELLAN